MPSTLHGIHSSSLAFFFLFSFLHKDKGLSITMQSATFFFFSFLFSERNRVTSSPGSWKLKMGGEIKKLEQGRWKAHGEKWKSVTWEEKEKKSGRKVDFFKGDN